MDPEMVWVLHNIPGEIRHQVHVRELYRWDPEAEDMIAARPEFNIQSWPAKQKEYL